VDINIGIFIAQELKKLNDRVFYELHPDDVTAIFPYITFFDRDDKNDENVSGTLTVSIDIWDNKSGNTLVLETLSKNIQKHFKNMVFSSSKFWVRFLKGSVLALPDTDPKIRRRQIVLIVKYYNKEEL